MINIRQMNIDKDYPILEAWWKARDWPLVRKDMLSEFGFLVSKDEVPVAATWLYPMLGAKICFMGFQISDKNSSKEDRDSCLNYLWDYVHGIAKGMGYKTMFTTSGIPALQNRLELHGYVKGDENVTQYFGGL